MAPTALSIISEILANISLSVADANDRCTHAQICEEHVRCVHRLGGQVHDLQENLLLATPAKVLAATVGVIMSGRLAQRRLLGSSSVSARAIVQDLQHALDALTRMVVILEREVRRVRSVPNDEPVSAEMLVQAEALIPA